MPRWVFDAPVVDVRNEARVTAVVLLPEAGTCELAYAIGETVDGVFVIKDKGSVIITQAEFTQSNFDMVSSVLTWAFTELATRGKVPTGTPAE